MFLVRFLAGPRAVRSLFVGTRAKGSGSKNRVYHIDTIPPRQTLPRCGSACAPFRWSFSLPPFERSPATVCPSCGLSGAMKKPSTKWSILLVLAAVVTALTCGWFAFRTPEPRFRGRPIASWVKLDILTYSCHLYPSSYRCDCGHESDFSESTVQEMERKSRRKRQHLMDSSRDEHMIEFWEETAVAVICPRLGRWEIKSPR